MTLSEFNAFVSHNERQQAINGLNACTDYHDLNKWLIDTPAYVRQDKTVDRTLMFTRARLKKSQIIQR